MPLEKGQGLPIVSIGIPTYNRAKLLKRAVESAVMQDYKNIEVIISDNASTDETKNICLFYCEEYGRSIKYIRQSVNHGATANFAEVLKLASGEFFMWLGDDDWIDISYVRHCLQPLFLDTSLSLVCGLSQYYRNNRYVSNGKRFNLLHETWWLRVALYYTKVADNGMFYGIMRTAQIRQMSLKNTMGGDWHLVAGLASIGKIKTITEVRVHRELGGASTNCYNIANSLKLPRIQAVFPKISIARTAWADIVVKGNVYKSRPVFVRLMLASAVLYLIFLKKLFMSWKKLFVFIIKKIKSLIILF